MQPPLSLIDHLSGHQDAQPIAHGGPVEDPAGLQQLERCSTAPWITDKDLPNGTHAGHRTKALQSGPGVQALLRVVEIAEVYGGETSTALHPAPTNRSIELR